MSAPTLDRLTAPTRAQLEYLKREMHGMSPHELRELITTIFMNLPPTVRTMVLEETFVITGGGTFNETRSGRTFRGPRREYRK
jgi:hypothetical protein